MSMQEFTFCIIDKDGNRTSDAFTKIGLLDIVTTLKNHHLHILDPRFNFKISSIKTTNKTVIIKLDFIKCIIFKKTAFVLYDNVEDAFVIDFRTEDFCQDLCKTLKEQTTGKFKHLIIEEILINVVENFEKNIIIIAPEVTEIKNSLAENNVDVVTSKQFIELQTKLLNLQLRITDIYELLDGLVGDKENKEDVMQNLDDDDDTVVEKKQTLTDIVANYLDRYEESYKSINEMLTILNTILELSQTVLGAKRNKMALYNLKLTVCALSISVCSLLAALLGMNVPNAMEEWPFAYLVVGTFTISVICLGFYFMFKMDKIF